MASASKKLLKELPSEQEMDKIIHDLQFIGHQATAIMGAAYLEHALELLLRAYFRPLSKSKREDQRIFDGAAGGILGTFSSKIRIAHASRLIHPKVSDALLLINDIRNVFAHSLHNVDFDHELIGEDCHRLAKISPAIRSAATVTLDNPPGTRLSAGDAPIGIYTKIVALLYRSIRLKVKDIDEGRFEPAA